ncbi:MAG: hypothetical protein LBH25_07185, partial [Fibromonadaceae bacterium]|nr:hypothetical protein [Fibromonadaceae bacterium]
HHKASLDNFLPLVFVQQAAALSFLFFIKTPLCFLCKYKKYFWKKGKKMNSFNFIRHVLCPA